MFFFDGLSELPKIEKIKKCLGQLTDLGDKIGAPIGDVDKKLSDEIIQFSNAMFCFIKQKLKTFTLFNDPRLKKMKIAEDADGFAEDDQIYIDRFLRSSSLEAFAELIAQSYLLEKPQKAAAEKRLFCVSVFSRYSSGDHRVFFSCTNGELFVFSDRPTNIKLSDYLEDYFSGRTSNTSENNITKKLGELVSSITSEGKTFVEQQKEVLEHFKDINVSIKSKYELISGAITFLDFLAWKGLWQSEKGKDALKDVSDLIDDFKEELNMLSEKLFIEAKEIPLSKLISISDTIAIFTPKVSRITECNLLELHARLAKYVLESCVRKKFPIRGAIAYGEYNIINNIMIGPGIDECASWHEAGNWIGVHFTPTAQIFLDEVYDKNEFDNVSSDYRIPLKNGLGAKYCVKWNVDKATFKDLTLNTRALLPEISGKYTNTYDFLNTIWKEDKGNGKE